jgi:copper(I)-binding protein
MRVELEESELGVMIIKKMSWLGIPAGNSIVLGPGDL